QVGRALRAVDTRLKPEWIAWSEKSTEGRRSRESSSSLSGATVATTGRARAAASYRGAVSGATVAATGSGRAAAPRRAVRVDLDLNLARRKSGPSAGQGSSSARRRRRLRAWCNEAWESFRPRTNADLPSCSQGSPVRELTFLRSTSCAEGGPQTVAPDAKKAVISKPVVGGGASLGTPAAEACFRSVSAHWRNPVADGKLFATTTTTATATASTTSTTATAANTAPATAAPVPAPAPTPAPAAPAAPAPAPAAATAANFNGDDNTQNVSAHHAHHGEQADVIDGDVEASTNESGVEGRRTVGVIAASVRARDWVLPVRRAGGVACGVGDRQMMPPEGKKKGGGWLRVEVVSIGKECLILASRGTGGTAIPSQRASMRLLELSPARLSGALIVRPIITPREGGEERVVGEKEDGEREGEG
ncbi:unnamed protein product, partial [Laminaria digitata]